MPVTFDIKLVLLYVPSHDIRWPWASVEVNNNCGVVFWDAEAVLKHLCRNLTDVEELLFSQSAVLGSLLTRTQTIES